MWNSWGWASDAILGGALTLIPARIVHAQALCSKNCCKKGGAETY